MPVSVLPALAVELWVEETPFPLPVAVSSKKSFFASPHAPKSRQRVMRLHLSFEPISCESNHPCRPSTTLRSLYR
jgi:hypothetical protein